MPEANTVPFQYEPVHGDLLLDHFRQMFYMERLGDVRSTLQYLCFAHETVLPVEGEIRFVDTPDETPVLRDLRYADHRDRAERGDPFEGTETRLWATETTAGE